MGIVQEIISLGGYKVINQFLTPDKWVRTQKRINPIGGVIHWTGNINQGADDRANRNFFENRVNSYGSAHTIGDGDSIIAALPYMPNDAEMGYHVGSEKYYANRFGSYPNGTMLGHEMCVNRDGNFRESYKRSVWILAYWSFLYNWNPEQDVVRHYDVTKKDCPLPFTDLIFDDKHCLGKGWSAADIKWMRDNLKVDNIQGEKLWKKFKSEVTELSNYYKKYGLSDRKEENKEPVSSTPTKTLPTITKERVYAENGVLKRCDGNYKITATDVRHIKFETGKVKYKFVYEKGATVSSLVKKHSADFGFNAPFFDIKSGKIAGDSWDGEKVVSKSYGKTLKWHGLSVRDGKPMIGKFDLNDKQDLLILGAPPLVKDGQLVYEKYRVEHEVNDDIGRRKCQRTFIWIDSKGDLHLGIADGRVPDSDVGLSLEEMALYAKSHGAVESICFDGGGSTILADQTGGLNQKLNTGKNERVVHHAILVFVKTDEEIKKEIEEKVAEKLSKYFKDVTVPYQAPSIDFCKEKGYIGGVSATEFNPSAPVSRGDLAVIVQRIVNDLMKEMKK